MVDFLLCWVYSVQYEEVTQFCEYMQCPLLSKVEFFDLLRTSSGIGLNLFKFVYKIPQK